MSPALDVLAIAAHRDDTEQTCGGTLLKSAQRGQHTGILDLTQGEMGTRGTAESRAAEAKRAAEILKVSWRHALDIPDGRVENTHENRLKVARVIREQQPLSFRAAAGFLSRARRSTLRFHPGFLDAVAEHVHRGGLFIRQEAAAS